MKLNACLVALAACVLTTSTFAQTTKPSPTSATPTAADALDQKASAVVKAMRFSDADKTEHVTTLTSDYLRQLRHILDQRAATLAQLGENKDKSPEIDQQTTLAWKVCRSSSVALRDAYVVRLSVVMTPFQVDRIKDGLTDDWYPKTVQVYDEMVPAMTYPQRAHLAGLLTEMRENAMLEIGVGPQEKWVDKYRGIINNYLAKQGHDFRALAKAYDEKHQAKK